MTEADNLNLRVSQKKRAIARKSPEARFGPGLITGAADDDPGGIATYSQAGAQLGPSILGQIILIYPLMSAIQSIAARIGRVTGRGLAANMLRVFPRPIVLILVTLLFIANTVNIGADLAAMGEAAHMITGFSEHIFTISFAVFSLALQILLPYHRYVRFLKWLTLALFSYVCVLFTVKIDWASVAHEIIAPHIPLTVATLTLIVAIFGTSISPYLFFWQSSEEVEDDEADPTTGPLISNPADAVSQLSRIRWDTYLGMGLASLIAFFIALTTSVTLHATGQTDIQSSTQAASALRPIAGDLAFFLFSVGIIGTGLLAVPVLAGSVAYAVSESEGWSFGLEHKAKEAPKFYAVIAAATLIGLSVDYLSIDPIKALFLSAVLNGLISVPIMAAMMIIATRREEMGDFTATASQRFWGWLATVLMAIAGVSLLLLMMLGAS